MGEEITTYYVDGNPETPRERRRRERAQKKLDKMQNALAEGDYKKADKYAKQLENQKQRNELSDQIREERHARYDSYKSNFGSWLSPSSTSSGDSGSGLDASEPDANVLQNYKPIKNESETIETETQKKINEYTPSTTKEGDVDLYTNDFENGVLSFELPDYGYEKYIMDIANWQRQRTTLGGEPGYYYFKIFFNFKTNYGLLGGLMTTVDGSADAASLLKSTNTAFGYLKRIRKTHTFENINERILSLGKFATTLKDMSLRTPWVFKTLSGLNTINPTNVENFDKEKTITIGFGPETLDGRIGTMMDLYKFACFDQINCKEIIPANLRKFEMSIMVYHMPLNNYHNKAMTSQNNAVNDSLWATLWHAVSPVPANLNFDGKVGAKNTNDINNYSNMMSFKLFTFLNCEIDCENANEYFTDGMSNEQAFQLGNNQLKIKYDRVYEHRMNEWAEMFFGSDGFYYNQLVPSSFYAMESVKHKDSKGTEVNKFKTTDFEINVSDQLVNRHVQRLNAINQQYIMNLASGKISIMDYQKLLIKRYYAPMNSSDPLDLAYIGDPMSQAGGTYSQWFMRNKDYKSQWYNQQGGYGSIFRL